MNDTTKNEVFETDDEGFLLNLSDWSPAIAKTIAQREDIQISEAHWEIIQIIKQYYSEYDHSPAMRPLVAYIKNNLAAEKASSIYLMKLFPGSPAKLAAKIAGLPRPENCL